MLKQLTSLYSNIVFNVHNVFDPLKKSKDFIKKKDSFMSQGAISKKISL